jgi:hypothetical protein
MSFQSTDWQRLLTITSSLMGTALVLSADSVLPASLRYAVGSVSAIAIVYLILQLVKTVRSRSDEP